jgi:hypothetical protein
MRIAYRVIAAWSLAIGLMLSSSNPLSAGVPDDVEPLVFELTLSGDVNPEDSFAVEHECEGPDTCQFIEDVSVFCSGDEQQRQDWGYPECAPGTYRLELGHRDGVTIHYALVRFPDGAADFDRHLAGSVEIAEGAGVTTIHLGWDYALTGAPTLPDTAIPGP